MSNEGNGISAEAAAAEVDSSGHLAAQNCLNCGASLLGSHCHQCGQRANLHRSLRAFAHDLIHGVLHIDGKIAHTLPLLIFKPGQLTRRYINGERAKFVSPMGLFLFTIFLMFAVFQIAGPGSQSEITAEIKSGAAIEHQRSLAEHEQLVSAASAALKAAPQGSAEYQEAKRRLNDAERELELRKEIAEKGYINTIGGVVEGKTNIPFLDKAISKWRAEPSLMLYKLQSNFYKFSWLLIPLSLPFVWLLFWRRRDVDGYDHMVFVTYSLGFMSLLLVLLTLLDMLGAPEVVFVFGVLVIPLVHILFQLKGTYGLSWWGTAWRMPILLFFMMIVCLLFLQILLLIGIF